MFCRDNPGGKCWFTISCLKPPPEFTPWQGGCVLLFIWDFTSSHLFESFMGSHSDFYSFGLQKYSNIFSFLVRPQWLIKQKEGKETQIYWSGCWIILSFFKEIALFWQIRKELLLQFTGLVITVFQTQAWLITRSIIFPCTLKEIKDRNWWPEQRPDVHSTFARIDSLGLSSPENSNAVKWEAA